MLSMTSNWIPFLADTLPHHSPTKDRQIFYRVFAKGPFLCSMLTLNYLQCNLHPVWSREQLVNVTDKDKTVQRENSCQNWVRNKRTDSTQLVRQKGQYTLILTL
ncbi:hypothetical protein GDO81_021899 [Engystomops pustulosus]|uniref:Uncharacterized protein n=1 Tax=Engystomops pustulosus TaxID=76066 RepID=A0AAV6ZP20_ENGPU|nr:hypothetical protein GDO81_021899 [Engystomops pustulosus]